MTQPEARSSDIEAGNRLASGRNGQAPLADARRIVEDLFMPNPLIYWADFLFSIGVGWGAFAFALTLPALSTAQFGCAVVATLALYRAVIFTHELAHLKKGTFKVFRLVWNVTCGVPLMVPSFTYRGVHNDHHKRDIYGTRADGEYLPFAVGRPYGIIVYLLLIFVLPVMTASRFIVFAPLSYLHGYLRRLVWERASSLTIDLSYRRPAPSPRDGKTWRLQEAACCLFGLSAIGLAAAAVLPYQALALWYAVAAPIFLLNSLRTLAAHCYRNPGDRAMDLTEQYLDSINVPGNLLLTALWAPVGLRYHATHHLFPAMPYHALGKAHRRLSRELPDGEVYLRTVRGSLWDALRKLWNEAASADVLRGQPRVGTKSSG
jgi:fatty acid desaturase